MQRFLVVDDHRLFLEGMRHLLGQLDGDIELDLAVSVAHALQHLDGGKKYDLLLLDIELPGMNGFKLIQSLRKRNIVLPIIVVSSTTEISTVRRCMELGALGFIHKNTSSSEMVAAIEKVLAGEISLPEPFASELALVEQANEKSVLAPAKLQEVGERQFEVLQLIDQGLSNKQISSVLAISEATVKYHIGILFKHFCVRNRTACLAKARDSGLLA